MESDRKIDSPPRTRVAVRIGITGHRTSGLEDADYETIRSGMGKILEIVRAAANEVKDTPHSFYADVEPPALSAISPLAEGADMLLAEEALKRDYKLECILPFDRNEYEKDFSDKDSHDYRDLLGKAASVMELNGSRESAALENEAYQAVGRMVLSQSDVLVTLWDGEDPKGKGGTGQIVKEALLNEIPVVWINSRAPHDIKILIGKEYARHNEEDISELKSRLFRFLRFRISGDRDLRGVYFSESQPTKTWGFLFEAFCDLFAGEAIRTTGTGVKDFDEETQAEWSRIWDSSPDLPEAVKEQINDKLIRHYGWADKLANYYSNIYRSSFLVNYLMAGFAVFFALLALTLKTYETMWVICELALIILIILITYFGNRRKWHERWIDYRLLSEQLRSLRFLLPIGHTTPAFRVPAHDTYGDPRSSWVNWHFRAIVREAGIVSVKMDENYLKSYRGFLSDSELAAQIKYHKDNSIRFRTINRNLHFLGIALFVLTFFAVFLHLFSHSSWLTLLAAVLPAFGAAFYGIRTQGEFEQVAKRSDAMSDYLENVRNDLNATEFPSTLSAVGYIAEDIAEIMSTENLDWRIVFQSKRLVLPG